MTCIEGITLGCVEFRKYRHTRGLPLDTYLVHNAILLHLCLEIHYRILKTVDLKPNDVSTRRTGYRQRAAQP